MKKRVLVILPLCLVCLIAVLKGNPPELIWVCPYEPPNQQFVNQVLKDKGYGFSISFLTISPETYIATIEDMIESEEQIDIISTGYQQIGDRANYINPYLDFVSNGWLCNIGDWIQNNTKIHSACPTHVWTALEIQDTIWGILPNSANTQQQYLLYDSSLFAKAGLDAESIVYLPVTEWEIDLEKLYHANNNNSIASIYPDPLAYCNGFSEPSFIGYTGIVCDEKTSNLEVTNFFATEEAIELWDKIQLYIKNGYFDDGSSITFGFFSNSEAANTNLYSPYQISKKPIRSIYFSGVTNDVIGIYRNSQYTSQAQLLLEAILTDPEVINAVAWGKEGVDYNLNPNSEAVKASGDSPVYQSRYLVNKFLSFSYPTESLVTNEEFLEEFDAMPVSKLAYQSVDLSKYAEVCKAVQQTYLELLNTPGTMFSLSLSTINSRLQDAGINILVSEINRQLKNSHPCQ